MNKAVGMVDIPQSRQLLMLLSGARKRGVKEPFPRRQITPHFPASFLWLHGNVDFLRGQAAMAGLGAP